MKNETTTQKLIPVYKGGELLYYATYKELVNLFASEKEVTLQLLRNEGKIYLDNVIFTSTQPKLTDRDSADFTAKFAIKTEHNEGVILKPTMNDKPNGFLIKKKRHL